MNNDKQPPFTLSINILAGNESQTTQESTSNSLPIFNLKKAVHDRQASFDSAGPLNNNSVATSNSGCSPSRKSHAIYQKADLNDFTKGISDMKVAYIPSFGHHTIQFDQDLNKWNLLTKNILNSHAPKHSAILEIVQSQQQQDLMMQQKQKLQFTNQKRMHKVSFQDTNEKGSSLAPSRQKSTSQLMRMNSRKKISNFASSDQHQVSQLQLHSQQSQYEIDKDVSDKLRWWKLGSKDDDEHGFRKTQCNFHIKIADLKSMSKESDDLLSENKNITNFFTSFKNTKPSQNLNALNSPPTIPATPTSLLLGHKLKQSISTLQLKLKKSPTRRNSSIFSGINKTSYLKKIKEQGQQKKKYYDTYLPSPREQNDSLKKSSTLILSNLSRFNSNRPSKGFQSANMCKRQHFNFNTQNQEDLGLTYGSHSNSNSTKTPQQQSRFFTKRSMLNLASNNQSHKTSSQDLYSTQSLFSKERSRIPQLIQPKSSHHQQSQQYLTGNPLISQSKSNLFSEIKTLYDQQVDFIKQRKEKLHKEWLLINSKMNKDKKSGGYDENLVKGFNRGRNNESSQSTQQLININSHIHSKQDQSHSSNQQLI